MRNKVRWSLSAAMLALAVSGTANPAPAEDSGQDQVGPQGPQDLAAEGLGKLLQALDLFVKSVPQYAAPEVLPNGDIILRRLNPKSHQPPKPAHPKSDDDATST